MQKTTMLLLLFMLFSVQAQVAKPKLKLVKKPPYTETLFQSGNIYIGGQPQFKDFALLKQAGFAKVINMRTPNEMQDLKFYQDYLLKKNNIAYDFIPIGGKEFKYSPAKLTEFAQSLESANGKVLLHCRSGHRASQLWAAYLVKYKGKSPNEALAMVKDMGWWPMPMSALLDKELSVIVVE